MASSLVGHGRISCVLWMRAVRLPRVCCTHYMVNTPNSHRDLHTAPLLAPASDSDLNKAKQRLTALNEDPGNDVKLKLYSLFKQVR